MLVKEDKKKNPRRKRIFNIRTLRVKQHQSRKWTETNVAEAGKEAVRQIKKYNKTMGKGTAKRGHNHDENEDEDNIHGDDDDT